MGDLLGQSGFHLIDGQACTARYDARMKIDLDPENLQVSMGLWRQATDMEIPLAPHLRSHFLTQRGALLEGFVKIAKNWTMLLDGCKASDDDLIALDALRGEIIEFKSWAERGIEELSKLATEIGAGKG